MINNAVFFAEGGESYAIRKASPQGKKDLLWKLYGWFSSLDPTLLPLSGHYRQSQIAKLTEDTPYEFGEGHEGWPVVMERDLAAVLSVAFQDDVMERGNAVQDLILTGFSE